MWTSLILFFIIFVCSGFGIITVMEKFTKRDRLHLVAFIVYALLSAAGFIIEFQKIKQL